MAVVALRGIAAGLACVAVLGAVACGGAGRGPTVALVDGAAIDASTVAHWGGVRSLGGIVEAASGSPRRTRRQEGLAFLISSRWLVGEAADRGMAITEQNVQPRLRELRQAVLGGDSAFAESLKSAGETVADVELEIRTELARSMMRRLAADSAGAVGRAKLLRYYRANREQYRVPEQRDIDIIEHLTSPAAARSLVRRIGLGRRFSRMAYQESPVRLSKYSANNEKAAVERAIFSARPGVLGGPMLLGKGYSLFIVRRVIPSMFRPFRQVRAGIAKKLAGKEQKLARAAFVTSYLRKWTARTDCRGGYVVPGCRQYVGSEAPESPLGEG